MKQKQYEKARAIIAGDCQVTHVYLDCRGRTCAIGALALAAGVDDGTLLDNYLSITSHVSPMPLIREAVWKEFGLSAWALARLQHCNDSDPGFLSSRAAHVVRELDSIASEYSLVNKGP